MKMYLDDIRTPINDYDVIVRSYNEAIEFVKNKGIPSFISFDHDLGCNEKGNVLKSGYDFAKWLVEMDIENIYKFPNDFSFEIHSANPIGKNNINSILNNYLIFKIKYK
ncbi:MAG: cyclic-phosphate processing receiver domain-containing protein [Arcobacter sp.]|uniref:cyclic-phosphate processing receiver domain-containing protein n=1 Tax=Arcobacter sp. TaxID=1872629 RepID=UPI003D048EEC